MERQEIINGFVFRKIKGYVDEHHPDLAGDTDYLLDLSNRYFRQYTGNLHSNMSEWESEYQAFNSVFNSISSPYSALLDFILENETKLIMLTKNEEISDGENVLAMLKLVNNELNSYMEAIGEEHQQHRGKQLLLALLSNGTIAPMIHSQN